MDKLQCSMQKSVKTDYLRSGGGKLIITEVKYCFILMVNMNKAKI